MTTENTTSDTDASPLTRAVALLANIKKARDAYRERQATIPPLEADHKAGADARAEAEAARVLALADGDTQGAKGAASDAKLHASAESKAANELDDARRVAAALRGRVLALEDDLQALHPALRVAVVEHQQGVLQELQTGLERAVQPLTAWAHRAARVASVTGIRIEEPLNAIRVPNLIENAALVGYGTAGGAVFGTVDDGVPLPDELGEPLRVLAAATGYRTLASSEAAVAFEVAAPTAGELTRRAVEARNAARAAELAR